MEYRIPHADVRDLVAWQRGLEPEEEAAHWTGGPSWAVLPARHFGVTGVRAWAKTEVAPALEQRLIEASKRRGVGLAITLIAGIHDAVGRLGAVDPPLLVMVEHRDRPELAELFTTLASLVACRVRSTDDPDARVAAIARAILDGREHADTIMRRPTRFHDGWPAALRGVAHRAGAALARLWPTLDPAVIGEYVRAIVPWPARRRGEVLVCVNVLPEVTQPRAGLLAPRRELPQMLRPDDLVVGKDPLLARTLQIHVTRAPALGINAYGGGLSPDALDALAGHLAAALEALAIATT